MVCCDKASTSQYFLTVRGKKKIKSLGKKTKKKSKQTNMASHVNSSPPSIGWPTRRINVTAALLLSVMHQFGIFLFFRPLYFRPRSEGGDTAAKITGLYAELAVHHHHQPPLSSAALFGSLFFFSFFFSEDQSTLTSFHPPVRVVHTGWILVPLLLGQLGPLPPSFSRF